MATSKITFVSKINKRKSELIEDNEPDLKQAKDQESAENNETNEHVGSVKIDIANYVGRRITENENKRWITEYPGLVIVFL